MLLITNFATVLRVWLKIVGWLNGARSHRGHKIIIILSRKLLLVIDLQKQFLGGCTCIQFVRHVFFIFNLILYSGRGILFSFFFRFIDIQLCSHWNFGCRLFILNVLLIGLIFFGCLLKLDKYLIIKAIEHIGLRLIEV